MLAKALIIYKIAQNLLTAGVISRVENDTLMIFKLS